MTELAYRSTYNPKTKKYFAFSDNYVPDPVNYRTDLWGEVGLRPTTWDNVLKAAPKLRAKINLLPIPRGPNGRLGLEHVMGAYVIWKFARNKAAAQKFLIDLETKYIGAFENSKFYNFPSWPASVPNIARRLERDPAKPAGKYKVLGTIADKYTLNPGYPGYSNAAIDEIFSKFMIPQMFAEVAQGKRTPEDAAKVYHRSFG